MSKITFADKVTLNPQPDIAEINKVTDANINEIKTAHNEINGTILWTNSSPTQEFAGQTITLSSNDYDILEIFYNQGTINTKCFSEKIIKGYSADLSVITNLNVGVSQPTGVRIRTINYSSDTELLIDDCLVRYDGTQASVPTVSNTGIIPLYIIGYKTGLFNV